MTNHSRKFQSNAETPKVGTVTAASPVDCRKGHQHNGPKGNQMSVNSETGKQVSARSRSYSFKMVLAYMLHYPYCRSTSAEQAHASSLPPTSFLWRFFRALKKPPASPTFPANVRAKVNKLAIAAY